VADSSSLIAPHPKYEVLQSGFVSSPLDSKIRVFWIWSNAGATRKSITQDLEAMKANGIGGVIIADNGT